MTTSTAPDPAAAATPRVNAEETRPHTRILQLSLALPESRAYWEHVDPTLPRAQFALKAFEERWFGARTLRRVRLLSTNLAARFDAFPGALALLRGAPDLDPATRRIVCHWHVMLSDPIYRAFAGGYLVERRAEGFPGVDRDAAARFVEEAWPGRWGRATVNQFAQKLQAAASEAGLISAKKDPRRFLDPEVPDGALAYLLHLLREVRIAGTTLENPYLASVGLTSAALERRLRALPGLHFRRSAGALELAWSPDAPPPFAAPPAPPVARGRTR